MEIIYPNTALQYQCIPCFLSNKNQENNYNYFLLLLLKDILLSLNLLQLHSMLTEWLTLSINYSWHIKTSQSNIISVVTVVKKKKKKKNPPDEVNGPEDHILSSAKPHSLKKDCLLHNFIMDDLFVMRWLYNNEKILRMHMLQYKCKKDTGICMVKQSISTIIAPQCLVCSMYPIKTL